MHRSSRKFERSSAKGSTALFAGVSKGAGEVRKFLDQESVNRVILLSDGQANVGPQSPRELERLGASLVKEGISVSTLGPRPRIQRRLDDAFGFAAGSGNHMFVEQADNLVAVFQKEFNDLMSVVASDFAIRVKIGNGIRPVRVLNTKADISGQDISIPLAQLYSRQQRYFVIEVEVNPGEDGTSRPMADVSVTYQNLHTKTEDHLNSKVQVRFSSDREAVAKARDPETFAYCAIQCANEKNIRATTLRDQGRVKEAQQLLLDNSFELNQFYNSYGGQLQPALQAELKRNAALNKAQSSSITDQQRWSYSRKAMREEQVKNASQQEYRVTIPKLKSGKN